jgi:hypothetical protein
MCLDLTCGGMDTQPSFTISNEAGLVRATPKNELRTRYLPIQGIGGLILPPQEFRVVTPEPTRIYASLTDLGRSEPT